VRGWRQRAQRAAPVTVASRLPSAGIQPSRWGDGQARFYAEAIDFSHYLPPVSSLSAIFAVPLLQTLP